MAQVLVLFSLFLRPRLAEAKDAGPRDAGRVIIEEPLPALFLREVKTGASLSFEHACAVDAETEPSEACATFRVSAGRNLLQDPDEIEGKRMAVVEVDGDAGRSRYFFVSLASIDTPGLDGESRARGIRQRMDRVLRSSTVTFGSERFLRVTTSVPKGIAVMFLAIDEGARQLAINFTGLEGWDAEELEATATATMSTFERPAVGTLASNPSSPKTSRAESLLVGFIALVILVGPFALIALRIFVRSSLRRHAEQVRDFAASRWTIQVVGEDCIACGERIVFDRDGAPCFPCNAPIHHRCAAAHSNAHVSRGHGQVVPYR